MCFVDKNFKLFKYLLKWLKIKEKFKKGESTSAKVTRILITIITRIKKILVIFNLIDND